MTIIVIEPKRERITVTTTETTTVVRTRQTTETRISTTTQVIEKTLEKTYTATTTQTIYSTETSITCIPTETSTQPYIPLIVGIAIGAITTITILKTRTKKQK